VFGFLWYTVGVKKKYAESVQRTCWVGEREKVIFDTFEEAEGWARVVEAERGLATGSLTVYKCEYGEHWHLASANRGK
jgi:hypothetical protein